MWHDEASVWTDHSLFAGGQCLCPGWKGLTIIFPAIASGVRRLRRVTHNLSCSLQDPGGILEGWQVAERTISFSLPLSLAVSGANRLILSC